MSKTKEELMKEVDMKKHREEQEKHRLQRAQNRKDYLETTMRKQRTHRLITRGAAMESIIPEIKDMSERAFYDAVETYFSTGNHREVFCNQIEFSNAVKEHADRVITDRAKRKEDVKNNPDAVGTERVGDEGSDNSIVGTHMSPVTSDRKTEGVSDRKNDFSTGRDSQISVTSRKGGA